MLAAWMGREFLPRTEPYNQSKLYANCQFIFDDSALDRNVIYECIFHQLGSPLYVQCQICVFKQNQSTATEMAQFPRLLFFFIQTKYYFLPAVVTDPSAHIFSFLRPFRYVTGKWPPSINTLNGCVMFVFTHIRRPFHSNALFTPCAQGPIRGAICQGEINMPYEKENITFMCEHIGQLMKIIAGSRASIVAPKGC